ncbi:arylsulfatase [Prescottella sp. R16]|uniref:arylsulfatase n=1 Tax=Prescottella sp. R16 TaxID=3064529 RepID=UPI00272E8225|nr:arylsulfatase [Prescottella sp. R16]
MSDSVLNAHSFAGTVTENLATATPAWPSRPRPDGAPDVVVMIVDDMGYSDIGPFGSEIPTPHLDAVAAEGARLTDFHVTPTCSPTRASLMTGCNSHAVGMGAVANVDTGFPGYAAELPAHQPTIAETFRTAGYSTMAIGKWHMCREQDMHAAGDRHSWPLQRGFDQYYGFLEAQANLHGPAQLYEGNNPVHVTEYPEGYYLTDDLTDRAVSMIAESHASDPNKPLLMYYAHAAVHAPMHIKPGTADKFRGRYDAGWEQIRAARRARQDELGVIPADVGTAPLDDPTGYDVPEWESLSEDGKRLAARHMENYAAMIETIDESVGRIRDVLRRCGRLENTIFVFLSDNGASGGGGGDVGVINHLANLNRTHTPSTEQRVAEEIGRLDDIGGPTTWPQYATAWATVANTPFRRHKFSTYRGGHQVSFLMSWPAGLGEIAGGIRHQYAHVTDLLPTIAELAGVPVATTRHGLDARPLDGTSMVAALRDPDAPSSHGDQYYECLGERAYYAGDWEAVALRTPMTPFSQDRWALYDVANDPIQLTDVAAENPDRVKELASDWEDAAARNQVYPMANGSPLHWFQRDPDEERLACETVLLPETPPLERFRASQLIDGRSFAVDVTLGENGYRAGDEGVLLAHGGQEAGYVLYVRGGALHLEQNAWGRTITADSAPIPPGARTIRLRVDAPGKHRWVAALEIDGTVVREGVELLQLSWLVPFSGLSAGTMYRSPVSWQLYRDHGMFPYTGGWERIVVRPGEYAPDAPAVMLDAIRKMGAATQ